jgi:hypothetical protein
MIQWYTPLKEATAEKGILNDSVGEAHIEWGKRGFKSLEHAMENLMLLKRRAKERGWELASEGSVERM